MMDHKDEEGMFMIVVFVLWMLSGFTLFFYGSLRFLSSGLPRLLSLLPFLPAFILFPGSLPSTCLRGILGFIFCWTCPAKLLLLCFHRSLDPPSWLLSRFSHFLAASLLPFRVIYPAPSPPKTSRTVLSRFFGLWYFVALVCCFNFFPFEALVPRPVLYALYVAFVFVGLQTVHWVLAIYMYACFKVELDPVFNYPFLATSLSDFWGKRWNLAVIAINRATIYEPVLRFLNSGNSTIVTPIYEDGKRRHQAQLPKSTIVTPIYEDGKRRHHAQLPKPSSWARAGALWTTFLVSGLMHELIFFWFSKSEPSWEATTFFVVHGFATCAEVAFRRILPQHLSRIPTWVSVLLTLSFNYATVSMFFLPAVLNPGTFAKCIAEYHYLQNWVLGIGSIL